MGATRYHLPADGVSHGVGLSDSHTRTEFARRLVALMHERGWNQTDLARRSGLKIATIGTYVRARSLPGHSNLLTLAETLGVKVPDLLPEAVENSVRRDPPALELRAAKTEVPLYWLDLNREIPMALGPKLLAHLPQDLDGVPPEMRAAEQLEMRSAAGHEDRAWIKMRKLMPLDTAQAIIRMVQGDDTDAT